ncbi:hypothetical protein AMTR_s00183p00032220 [Amborella trichopoda]|uniref:Uncharacterized protein n=1 Tax=Amborella trichopoda TaxID=13333 RepID=U5D398_AMBTC|nr:hypothetical protein AMTR_s00183p00032220 [Amborella trichopoda]
MIQCRSEHRQCWCSTVGVHFHHVRASSTVGPHLLCANVLGLQNVPLPERAYIVPKHYDSRVLHYRTALTKCRSIVTPEFSTAEANHRSAGAHDPLPKRTYTVLESCDSRLHNRSTLTQC